MKYMCADCGYEQDSMKRRCDTCNSVRVVLASFVGDLLEQNDLTQEDCFDDDDDDDVVPEAFCMGCGKRAAGFEAKCVSCGACIGPLR